MLKSLKNKLSRTNNNNNNNKNSEQQQPEAEAKRHHPPATRKSSSSSSSALKRIQHSMGNLASSILSRHHTIDGRQDFAQRLMTSLDEMRRNGGLECDVMLEDGSESIPVHSIVISYTDALYQMCKKIELETKEAGEDKTETVLDDKTEVNDEKKEENNEEDQEKVEDKEDKEQIEDPLQQQNEESCKNESSKDPETSETKEEKEEDIAVETTKSQDAENQQNQKEEPEQKEESDQTQEPDQKEELTEQEEPAQNEEPDQNEELTEKEESDQKDETERVADAPEEDDTASKDNNPEDVSEDPEKKDDGTSEVSTESPTENGAQVETPTEANEEKEESGSGDCVAIMEEKPQDDNSTDVTNTTADDVITNYAIAPIVGFLYESRIRIDADNVDRIRMTSEKLQLDELVAACDRFKQATAAAAATGSADVTASAKDVEAGMATGSQEPFIYEDPTLCEKMLDHFNQLRLSDSHIDCDVITTSSSDSKNRKAFEAHRALLCAVSSHFRKVVPSERTSTRCELSDDEFPAGTLIKCLTFFYTGSLKVSTSSVQRLIVVAKKLDAKELVDGCGEILESNLNNDNCFKLRQLAVDNETESLLVAANRWIAHHLIGVTKTLNYKQLDVDTVERILTTDNLNLDYPLSNGEMVIFNAATRWLQHDLENRKKHTERILSAVRFPLIGLDHLLNDVSTNQLVMADDVIVPRIAATMAGKKSELPECTGMRGNPCILTCGGSAIIDDVTSENQDYTPVGYYHKVTLYDCESSRFYDWASLPESRSLHCAVTCGQFLFILGGYDPYSCISNDVYYLDMSSGQWRRGPSMKTKRVLFTAHVIKETIYVVGGLTPRGYQSSVDRLDVKTMKWQKSVPMPSTRYRHAGCVMENEIFVSGGNEGTTSCSSFDCDVGAGWKERSSMLVGRDSHVMACVDDVIVCAGGEGIKFSVERLHNEVWEMVRMPEEVKISEHLYYPSYAVHQNLIYLFGGWVGENEPSDEVWSFNPHDNEWKKYPHELPIALGSAASCVVTLPESYWKTRLPSVKLQAETEG